MKLDFQVDSYGVSEFARGSVDSFSDERIGTAEKLQAGVKAAQAGDRTIARTLLLQVAEVEPENEEAWLWLASISEYPEELLVFLNNVLQINPENERALNWAAATKSLLSKSFAQRGIDALKEKQVNFARQCFLQAIASDAANEQAWLWLASASDAVVEKIECLEKVLTLDPENETAQSSLRVVRREMAQSLLPQAIGEAFGGRKTRALETLENIIAHAPDIEEAWLLKSFLVESFDRKIQCLEQVLEINSDNKAARANHAFLLSMRTKFKAVEENKIELADGGDQSFFQGDELNSQTVEGSSEFTENFGTNGESGKDFAASEQKFESISFDSAVELSSESVDQSNNTDEDSFASSGVEETAFESFGAAENLISDVAPEINAASAAPRPFVDLDDNLQIFDVPELPETAVVDDTVISDEFAEIYDEYDVYETGEPLNETKNDNAVEDRKQPDEIDLPSYYEADESVSLEFSGENDSAESVVEAELNSAVEIQTAEEKFSYSEANKTEQPIDLTANQPAETTSENQAETSVCPFCAGENEEHARACGACGATLSLAALEMLFAARNGDEAVIRSAVEEMEKTGNARELDHAELKFLGIGHINLKDFRYGLTYLQEAAQARPNDHVFGSEVNAFAVRLAEIEARQDIAESTVKNKTILVVDDSATVRKLIAGKLEKCGHAVVCAADGAEALEKIKKVTPDLVLLDIMMPQMDGYQVCKLIRADENTRDVPVVMISGKDGFFDKVRGRMVGTTGYITKPFGPETLMKTIESYIPQSSQPD